MRFAVCYRNGIVPTPSTTARVVGVEIQRKTSPGAQRIQSAVGATRPRSGSTCILPACLKNRSIDEKSSVLPHEDRLVHISRGLWDVDYSTYKWIVTGSIRVSSLTPGQELFIPEVQCSAKLLSKHAWPLSSRNVVQNTYIGESQTTSLCRHVSPEVLLDSEWGAPTVPILRADEAIHIPVHMTFEGTTLTYMTDLWIQLEIDVYGAHGVDQQRQDVVLPIKCPPRPDPENINWSPCPHMAGAETLPITTHLLCHLDDPASVVEAYAAEAARSQDGTIVCIAESAVAIMQVACDAGALEALQSTASMLAGALGMLIGIGGVFYKVVGRAATAIDDLTGTLAPYDRFVVFGPTHPCTVVHDIEERTGLQVAIVDVNDLSKTTGKYESSTGGVSILSHSRSIDPEDLKCAIMHNPGGNGNEQTPLLIVRGLHCGWWKSSFLHTSWLRCCTVQVKEIWTS